MKVLQINTVCGSGSVGRITVDISHALTKSGEECLIAYGRRTAPETVYAWKFGSRLDMGIHVLSTFLKGEHGFASKRQTARLIEKIKEYDPDVIQLHNIHGFYLNVEQLFRYLKTSGKPVVWTLHDCWPMTGHCAYFDYVGCEKWKQQCGTCPLSRSAYPYALFKDNSCGNYTRKKAAWGVGAVPNMTIVTPSRWLKGLVEESFLKDYEVRVIPNGIDVNRFVPPVDAQAEARCEEVRRRVGAEGKYLVLGVANMWEERKGFPYFLKLAECLGDDYKIVLIGVDKKKQKELPDSVVGVARTESVEELAAYYAAADVFVNPTLEDNFPTTNLEALACGTPVITFGTGGSVESVDEHTGRIVKKGDLEGLRQAIIEITKNPLSPEKCREKGLKYDKYERFMEYVQLYRSLKE